VATDEAASYRQARYERLLALLDRLALDALLLRRSDNFAWFTGGADSRVNHASPLGVADLLVTHAGVWVVTNTIEARRMREEETPDLTVVEHPWEHPDRPVRDLIASARLGADYPLFGARDITDELAPLRYVLDPDAIARYRQVGADTRAALDAAVSALEPGITEDAAAARVLAACRPYGLHCPVVLAAADERIARYRHPIPHGRIIRERAMIVLCAERMLHFAPPSDELRRRDEVCDVILRRMRTEATYPGRTLADAFADCQRFYAEAGYPDEWRLHHQGGLSGYASREVIATPHTSLPIQVGHAFAWNPSITGTKSEETFILTERGPVII
jgi:antitoxin VapB